MHKSMDGSGSNGAFIKGALTFSIMTMVLMTSFITIFVPSAPSAEGYDAEMEELLQGYKDITGASAMSEEIWGLTGIYTPYGVSPSNSSVPSTAYLRTDDGWISGGRVSDYTPSQLGNINNGDESYTVTYDTEKKLYYYTSHGADYLDIVDGTSSSPSSGSLYTSVCMEIDQKSNQFFTTGTKKEMDNGTFYYSYTGYRYCFQPLRDYYYNNGTPLTHTTTSLSLIWYQYGGDDGISGQLVLTGSDSGVSYLTGTEIVNAFNSVTTTSKFVMKFNGIDMNIYIHLNPWAINHGYTVQQCYDAGLWSIMVTSPADAEGLTNSSTFNFDITKMVGVVIGLLTFKGEDYGLTGFAGTVASTVFTVSMYTSLTAISVMCPAFFVLEAVIILIQTVTVFLDNAEIDFPW